LLSRQIANEREREICERGEKREIVNERESKILRELD
jgi:hypothetical protein